MHEGCPLVGKKEGSDGTENETFFGPLSLDKRLEAGPEATGLGLIHVPKDSQERGMDDGGNTKVVVVTEMLLVEVLHIPNKRLFDHLPERGQGKRTLDVDLLKLEDGAVTRHTWSFHAQSHRRETLQGHDRR